MNEVKLNDRVKMTVKPLATGRGAREPTRVGANKAVRRKGLFKVKRFELRVKLMAGGGK